MSSLYDVPFYEIPVRNRIIARKVRIYKTTSRKPSLLSRPWVIARGRPGRVGVQRVRTFEDAVRIAVQSSNAVKTKSGLTSIVMRGSLYGL